MRDVIKNVVLLNTPATLTVFLLAVSAASVALSAVLVGCDGVVAYVLPALLISASSIMSALHRVTHDSIVVYAHTLIEALTRANPVMFDRRGRAPPITKDLIALTQVNNGIGGFAIAAASTLAIYLPVFMIGLEAIAQDPVMVTAVVAAINFVLCLLVATMFTWRYEQRKFVYLYRVELDNMFAPRTRTNHNPKR